MRAKTSKAEITPGLCLQAVFAKVEISRIVRNRLGTFGGDGRDAHAVAVRPDVKEIHFVGQLVSVPKCFVGVEANVAVSVVVQRSQFRRHVKVAGLVGRLRAALGPLSHIVERPGVGTESGYCQYQTRCHEHGLAGPSGTRHSSL